MLSRRAWVLALLLSQPLMASSFRESVVWASFYGKWHQGKLMANGKKFDMNAFTAAHKTLPLGSCVLVTNPDTSSRVPVEITDRGPFVKGRSIDLSQAAAIRIGLVSVGVKQVKIALVNRESCRKSAAIRTDWCNR